MGAAYANALVDLAQETNTLEAVHADMDAFQSMLKDSPDIMEFLVNPVVLEDKKKEMLASVAKEVGFNPYTVNFFNLLLDSSRMDAIEAIFEAFEAQYCKLTDTQVCWFFWGGEGRWEGSGNVYVLMYSTSVLLCEGVCRLPTQHGQQLTHTPSHPHTPTPTLTQHTSPPPKKHTHKPGGHPALCCQA